jgi:hypothetical protein
VSADGAMQNRAGMGSRMPEIVLEGVSTRRYGAVIPKTAIQRGSRSPASAGRRFKLRKHSSKNCFDDVNLLIIFIDGHQFRTQCVIGPVGVDEHGKACAGVQGQKTDNAAAARDLVKDLVARGQSRAPAAICGR